MTKPNTSIQKLLTQIGHILYVVSCIFWFFTAKNRLFFFWICVGCVALIGTVHTVESFFRNNETLILQLLLGLLFLSLAVSLAVLEKSKAIRRTTAKQFLMKMTWVISILSIDYKFILSGS